MLFNSYEFIFAFLPATLAVFFLLGERSRSLALGWLVVASLFYYAWWRPLNVAIIAPSIAVNYVLARWLLALRAQGSNGAVANWVLALGIVFNVCFLAYFKYLNFFAVAINDIAGTNFVLERIVLPLGISFITFQKIAFLIDVHGRRVESFTLRDYALFVFFFPQLIAGPIVHYREVMPQFHAASCRYDRENLALGLTLFVFGLFKKVVLADGIAEHVTPIYEAAAGGAQVSLLPAWIAAVGFTLQIYFDFSGYSDMALGLGRCVGVKLPPNFDSPLKSTNIIDFWLRWHMTLTRFLTAYLYNPLVLWLTRRRIARRLPVLGGKRTSAGAFLQLLGGPTLLTMFVSGLWHGAGYLFIAWGVLHGLYLVINHAWRQVGPRLWPSKDIYARIMRPVGFVLTFLAVAVAMVLFRSANGIAASELLQGMAGLNGVRVPQALYDVLGPLKALVAVSAEFSTQALAIAGAWVAVLLSVALALPNTLQFMARYEPALLVNKKPGRILDWNPSLAWATGIAVLAAASIMKLGGKSEFLYWQF
jgi:D-alanyl-lipoteichoic acid acyltransferase DltB (MBOAT superfamily)